MKLIIRLSLWLALLMPITLLSAKMNPFFDSHRGPHGTFPFSRIQTKHYMPAFERAMELHQKEIAAIVNQRSVPTFENTIEALDASGAMLSEVAGVFFNLEYTEGTPEMMEVSQQISPLLSKHQNDITLNERLFDRVKQVYDRRDELELTAEQQMLLRQTYLSFANHGANLSETDKETYRKLSEELSQKTLTFGQHVLLDTNDYDMILTDEDQLKGLPESFREQSRERAQGKGQIGWLINLQAPSYIPFMKYSDDRALRERLYKAYGARCFHDKENGNTALVHEIANVRLQIANLLGYPDYASYVLQEKMAKNPEGVLGLLDDLLEAYTPVARKEVAEVEAFAQKSEGKDFELMPWDWSYYAEKLKSERYAIDDNILKPYLSLEAVKKGVFDLATQLYGITFKLSNDIEVYNESVEAYEVYDKTGSLLSVFYVDFFPRETKRPGAWMTAFREQSCDEAGNRVIPFVSIVMNFTPATASTPSLLTYDEVETLLHEFGHALHGMLSDVTYESLSGTSVYQDFVELPSQIMENWASQKAYLDQFARHYQTGEKIDEATLAKIVEASRYNAGYACLRQLSFGYLDMAWHTARQPITTPVGEFERAAFKSTQLLPMVDGMCMSTAFSHIFAGGYAAGYYGYKWAEVLDADAFSLFLEKGIFDQKTAQSFRDHILSKGGSEDPATLYEAFRGRKPSVKALLERDGVKN